MKEQEEIELAEEEFDEATQEARKRRIEELKEKAIMDEIAIRDSGYKEGFEIGRQEAKIRIIKEVLKENMDIEFISEVTDSSVEEIENIKNCI